MSAFFYSGHQQHHHTQTMHHNPQPHSHHGRSRRAPRLPASHRHYRQQKPQKEVATQENPGLAAFRARFEAGRSFDLDDDLEFCPNLLTFDEKQSMSSGSDRSSLSSGSPESSPLQHQLQPEPMSLSSTSSYISPPVNNNNTLKVYQPSAIRSGTKAIPIVNPSTGTRIASPPNSISPAMMHLVGARW